MEKQGLTTAIEQNVEFYYKNKKSNNKCLIGLLIFLLLLLIFSFFYFGSIKEIGNKNGGVSVIFISMGTADNLNSTLASFFQMNTYPVEKIVIAVDVHNFTDKSYGSLIEEYESHNIKWISSGNKQKIGQILLLDQAYKQIESKYVLVSPVNQIYIKKGFIEAALQTIEKNSGISQVILKNFDGETSINLTIFDTPFAGFSFRVGLSKLSHYKMLGEGGYTAFTRNTSYGKRAGRVQQLISLFYYDKGLRVKPLSQPYMRYIDNQVNNIQRFTYHSGVLLDKDPNVDSAVCWLANKLFRSNRETRTMKREIKKQVSTAITKYEIPQQFLEPMKALGLTQQIQIESELNFMNISKIYLDKKLKEKWPKTFNYELRRHEGYRSIIHNKPFFERNFKTLQQAKNHLSTLHTFPGQQPSTNKEEISYRLATHILLYPNDEKLLQIQYKYYKEKYNFDKIEKELPICVFVEGFNGITEANLFRLFASIQYQNYTNYQFVYVDDFSTDESKKKVYQFMSANFSRLLYKLKQLVMNEEVMYNSGNHYLRVKEFCDNNDIVVTLNLNSSLIGRQFFKVLNAIYQDPNTWVAMFHSIQNKTLDQNKFQYIHTQNFQLDQNIRYSSVQIQSYLKTFRYQLVHKFPIQHLIQYSYHQDYLAFAPRFFHSSSDRFWVYSLLELSGKKSKIFNEIFMYYNSYNIIKSCYLQKQAYQSLKSQIKYPLVPLENLNDTAIIKRTDAKLPQNILTKMSEAYQKYQQCIAPKNQTIQPLLQIKFSEYLSQVKSNLIYPKNYISPLPMQPYEQLPICIVIIDNENRRNVLIRQLLRQNYKNFTILRIMDEKHQSTFEDNNVREIITSDDSYKNLLKITKENCIQWSIILFTNHPLKYGALNDLNKLYQTKNIWLTYSETENYFMVNSFYWRIYELLNLTDFKGFNTPYLNKGDFELQALGLMEISLKRSYKIEPNQFYNSKYIFYYERLGTESPANEVFTVFTAYKNNQKIYLREPYSFLLELAQDTPVNSTQMQQYARKAYQGHQYGFKPFPNSMLTKNSLFKSIEYRQILYMPRNHLLNRREYEELDEKYNIGKYMDNQLRFCIVVSGRNNTQNNRHYKNLKTLFTQEYDNFVIIYIDDVSDDATMAEAMEFTKKEKFPKEKIVFVQNINRKFASYNTINAAFNFCGQDDIQVKFDADDELIGRHAISVLNAVYNQHPEYWLIYTNLVAGTYNYGLSLPVLSTSDYLNCDGTRRKIHLIAPLKAWRVKLIRSVPDIYHKLQTGQWLDTLEDDALQACFLQMATIQRISYIPWINYYRNVHYGSNDDSNRQKVQHRSDVFEYMLTLPMLQPLKDLNERYKNPTLSQSLKSEWNKEFKVLDL